MRQFFIFLCFFSCASVLADHGGNGWNYNGRTFKCNTGFENAKRFAENAKELSETEEREGRLHYSWAFCQLHHGPQYLPTAIASLQTALDKGFHGAAIILAEYFISDGFNLSKGNVTRNEPNFLEALKYRKQALTLIHNQPNYPFSDPYGDDLKVEKADRPYLKTAGNITTNYLIRYIRAFKLHRNTDTDIENATTDALNNTIKAAETCLAIEYIERPVVVWNRSVYDKTMNRCEASKLIAEILLPLETERLRIASENCQYTKLSKCTAHQTIEKEMLRHYKAYKVIADQLLQQLATL